MTDTPEDPAFVPEDYARAVAGLLALPIEPAWMPSIVANLRVLHAAADLVGDFPLPDEAEAAPVFAA